jgi:hypothetical protein
MTSPSGTQNFKPDDSRVPTVAKVADEDVLEEQRLEEEEAEAQRQAEVEELNEPLDEFDQEGYEHDIER